MIGSSPVDGEMGVGLLNVDRQSIAIAGRRRHVDVTVFRALPRSPENCQFIIEAKRLGSGLEGALEQAKGYLRDLGIEREIVVTDGIRYRMYEGSNNFAHIAYANLDRLKVSASILFAHTSRR